MERMRLMKRGASHRFEETYWGGSQSDEICQITADMFGIPSVCTQPHEVAGIGAFKDYHKAVSAMAHKKDGFIPDMEQ